jgi:hypothetical protein
VDFVTLLGAEDVKQAGYDIKAAASEIKLAMGFFEEALQMHERFLTDWLEQLEAALTEKKEFGLKRW